jgi:long-chain acyl-CoA synthetase
MEEIMEKQYEHVNQNGMPVVVRDILERSASLYADTPAYMVKSDRTSDFRSITYREMYDDIGALGAAMTELGLKGKKVAIIGENCYQWIITYLAGVCGGIVVVPLGSELSKDEIYNLLDRSGVEALFYTERFDEVVAGADVSLKFRMNRYETPEDIERSKPALGDGENIVASTWRGLLAYGKQLPREKIEAFRTQEIDPDAMSLLMFTSGTTGRAKGVMISTRHIGNNAWDMEQAHNIHPGDVTVSILPIYHIFEAVMGQQFMLAHGATIAFSDGIKYLKENMREVRADVQLLVPLLVENFYKTIWRNAKRDGREEALREKIRQYHKVRKTYEAEDGKDDDRRARAYAREFFKEEQSEFGGKLDIIFTGAAAIDARYIKGLQDIGIKVTQGYGMTEAGCLVTSTPYFSDTYGSAGSVGPSVPSGKIKISEPDEDGVGEIMFTGPCVMKGYYNMPVVTA